MEPDDEIKQLLREIRDQQKGFQDEWRRTWEQARQDRLEQRAYAERSVRGAKRGQWVWLVVIVALIAIAAGLPSMLYSCAGGLIGHHGDRRPPEEHEARAWLNQNENEAPLASNRFESKAEAIEFVEKLYEAGAKKVYVTYVRYDEYEVKEYGGPYADALIVELPKDTKQRAKLFAIYAAETVEEGFPAERDRGQSRLFFWWD